MLEIVVGWAVLVVSLSTKLIGDPDQIRRNWQRKSTAAISPILYVLTFAAHSLWTIHGVLHADWFLTAAQGVGVITSGIIITQIWAYRARDSRSDDGAPELAAE